MPSEYPLNSVSFSSIPIVKNISSNNLDENGCNDVNYRNIPVTRTADILKTPGIYCENVSGGKEVKDIIGMLSSNKQYSTTNSIFKYKSLTGPLNYGSQPEAGISVNTLQRKLYPGRNFFNTMGKGSVSEPARAGAKDRGDNVAFRDMYGENNFLKSKYLGDCRSVPPKERGMKGCIYIKKSGKVYKSKIEAKCLKIGENEIFFNTKKEKYREIPKVGKSHSMGKLADHAGMFEAKSGSEDGDFEIAIFLSGLKPISNRRKQMFSKEKLINGGARKGKRKKCNVKKNTDLKSYQSSSKLLKINSQDADYSHLSYKVAKSDINLNFLNNDSDSDSLGNENNKILKRKPERASDSFSFASTYKSRKTGPQSHRSLLSESSISPYVGDLYGIPKLKISDGELWEKFESTFRSYASTSRHSGEVIPKKISTEWMTNVGVVNEYMTEREADEAFKFAAGVKITMNSQEYKEFLIMLSLRMKLPFYEIYRRMCGV